MMSTECWKTEDSVVKNGLPRLHSVKKLPDNAGDTGWIPGSGRPPWVGSSNLLQYSCLENFMDRGAWQATVHGVAKSQTRLQRLSTHTHKLCLQFFLPLYWAVKAYRNSYLISFVPWLPSFSSKWRPLLLAGIKFLVSFLWVFSLCFLAKMFIYPTLSFKCYLIWFPTMRAIKLIILKSARSL